VRKTLKPATVAFVPVKSRPIKRMTEGRIAFGDAQSLFKHPPTESQIPARIRILPFYFSSYSAIRYTLNAILLAFLLLTFAFLLV